MRSGNGTPGAPLELEGGARRGGIVGGRKRRVLKFGGTSVGTAGALRCALGIAETASRERPVVIVVSALAGVTNALEAALSGAAASRLDIAGFAAAIRGRHLALLAAVAQGRPALRAAAAVRERVAELEGRLRAVAADGAFSPATRAGVLALGERLSVPVVEAALRTRGLEAFRIPVFVGNTLRPGGPGTWIGPAEATIEEAEEAGTAA